MTLPRRVSWGDCTPDDDATTLIDNDAFDADGTPRPASPDHITNATQNYYTEIDTELTMNDWETYPIVDIVEYTTDGIVRLDFEPETPIKSCRAEIYRYRDAAPPIGECDYARDYGRVRISRITRPVFERVSPEMIERDDV